MAGAPAVLIPSYLDPQRALRAAAAAQEGQAVPLRVLVVDDGSPGDPWADVQLPAWMELVRRGTNGGFARAVNDGLAEIPLGDVVLLNSDVHLATGWLPLVQESAAKFGAAVVGIRLHYPGGVIQHAGGVPIRGGWFGHIGETEPLARVHRTVFGVPFVTGAFWYWTRRAIETLGGLDVGYHNGVEDIDYCMRAWEAGLPVVYDGRAHALHECGATRRAAGFSVGVEGRANVDRFIQRHWSSNGCVAGVPHA